MKILFFILILTLNVYTFAYNKLGSLNGNDIQALKEIGANGKDLWSNRIHSIIKKPISTGSYILNANIRLFKSIVILFIFL